MTSKTGAESKQKDHHSGTVSFFFTSPRHPFCTTPDTIILFAIFNVNITPNKCPRKQNDSSHFANQQKKFNPF